MYSSAEPSESTVDHHANDIGCVVDLRDISQFQVFLEKSILSRITAAITEPEPAIIHLKNTRKPGFACIALLSTVFSIVDSAEYTAGSSQYSRDCHIGNVSN